MAKFYGVIGFGITEENSPGVWVVNITEKTYYGDVIENTRKWETGESTNDDFNISNKISVLADSFAYQNIGAMKYVKYLGQKWKVRQATISYPRIVLTLGDLYHEQSIEIS